MVKDNKKHHRLSHSPVYRLKSPNVHLCEKINPHRFGRHSHTKQRKSLLNLLVHFQEWVRYGHDQLEITIGYLVCHGGKHFKFCLDFVLEHLR